MSRKVSRKPLRLSMESLERREMMTANLGWIPVPSVNYQPPAYVAPSFSGAGPFPRASRRLHTRRNDSDGRAPAT